MDNNNDIKVISQNTKERENETIELFNKVKPLLDKGYIYSKAVREIKGQHIGLNRFHDAWYRDLIAYGESQGYFWNDYSGKRKRK